MVCRFTFRVDDGWPVADVLPGQLGRGMLGMYYFLLFHFLLVLLRLNGLGRPSRLQNVYLRVGCWVRSTSDSCEIVNWKLVHFFDELDVVDGLDPLLREVSKEYYQTRPKFRFATALHDGTSFCIMEGSPKHLCQTSC